MLTHDEKRDFIRMQVDCEITYRQPDGQEKQMGRCKSISGAGISFIAQQNYAVGLAMEVSISPKTNITPPMTAFIEVVRTSKLEEGSYEIAAIIKSIKGNGVSVMAE